MKNSITPLIPELTIGLDLSDRTARYCELNAAGEIVEEGQLKLDPLNLRRFPAVQPAGARVALETALTGLGQCADYRVWSRGGG